jgi:hypothetical protein
MPEAARRPLRPFPALGLLLLLFPAAAFAGDPVEDARIRESESFIETLARFAEARDKKALAEALPRFVKIHNELKTEGARAKVRRAVGALLDDEELGAVRMKAADAFGRINDPKGGWQELRGHMPDVSIEACGPFPLRVVQAVGALAPDEAITALRRLMEKAKDANVSRYAIQALGKYGWSSKRVRILKDLATLLSKMRPGAIDPRKGRGGGGEAARQRYQFLRETLTAALNELTGQALESADAWIVFYKENKKSPKKLFKVER